MLYASTILSDLLSVVGGNTKMVEEEEIDRLQEPEDGEPTVISCLLDLLMTSQQCGCLNKTCIMTSPVNIPMGMEISSARPTRRKSSGIPWLQREGESRTV